MNIKNRKESGFTIIEVLIVLAIAGLIMVIVFLAVPALQRNQRNTARKEDAGNLLAAVSEYAGNNNGQLPTSVANITDNVQLGKYTTVTIVTNTAGSSAAQAAITNPDTDPRVVLNARCGTNGATAAGYAARRYAIQYAVEVGSSGNQPVCTES